MKVVGYVSNWFDAKNFGFIHENKNGQLVSYFFHRKHLIEGIPAPNKVARFNIQEEPKGPVAIDVEIFQSKTEMERADALAAIYAGVEADLATANKLMDTLGFPQVSDAEVADLLAGSTTPSTEVSK